MVPDHQHTQHAIPKHPKHQHPKMQLWKAPSITLETTSTTRVALVSSTLQDPSSITSIGLCSESLVNNLQWSQEPPEY